MPVLLDLLTYIHGTPTLMMFKMCGIDKGLQVQFMFAQIFAIVKIVHSETLTLLRPKVKRVNDSWEYVSYLP